VGEEKRSTQEEEEILAVKKEGDEATGGYAMLGKVNMGGEQ